jgi:hypothetical protein
MLPVHIQDLFGGNVIKFKGKHYTVIDISRSFSKAHHCCLKARGVDDRDLSIFLESPCMVSIIWFFLSQLIFLIFGGEINLSTILAAFIGAFLGGIVAKWLLPIYR